jgi:hypothetical protein
MLVAAAGLLNGCSSADETKSNAPAPTVEQAPATPLPSNTPLECDPGMMASIELGQCMPVGPTNVPTSFTKARDGFRLVATVPAKACAAGERPAIGKTACVPIDDGCDHAFPPVDAAFVVVPGAASSGKTVGTIAEALSRAKTGDLVALESGEHPTFESTKALRFVGRCASKVKLKPTVDRTTGVWFTAAGKSSLESVTIEGAKTGLRGGNDAGEVTVRRVLFSGNENALDCTGGKVIAQEVLIQGTWTEKKPAGTGVAAQGATIELEDSAILDTGTHIASVGAGARVIVRRSVVRGPSVETGALSSVLFAATMGGAVEIEESVLTTTQALGIADSGSTDAKGKAVSGTVRIARSELTQTGKTEIALTLTEGGRATLEDTSIFHKAAFGIGMVGGDLELTRSAIVADSQGSKDVRELLDIAAQSHVTMTESALVGGFNATVSMRGAGSTFTMDRSLLTGTRYYQHGRGIELEDRAVLTVRGSAITAVEGTGVLVSKAGSATIESTLIDAPRFAKGQESSTGVGVTVHEASCVLDRVIVRRAAGPAVEFSSGSAIINSSRITDSLVGVLLISTDDLMKVEDEPTELLDGHLLVYRTELAGNGTDVTQADGFVPPSGQ